MIRLYCLWAKSNNRTIYRLNVQPGTTMQEVTTKIQEQDGLQLHQVSLSMVKKFM